MEKKNKSHVERVKKLIIGCSLCAIILTASTYAWFVGMKTVNVTSFDVKIAAIDGLSLSLNGSSWSDTVNISETICNDSSAVSSCSWGGDGLIPLSSVGKIDQAASKMILFEKGSFTTTPGGFRIMATRVPNQTNEQSGYVAFDLFVKNLSGAEYYTDLEQLNEEAIYLTVDSSVTVAQNGGEAGTGIENSVRVAFAQIGRVKATTTNTDTIKGITCTTATATDGKTKITGITDRDAQIWEPNDKYHVANAISWYTTSCKKRIGTTITDSASYSGACSDIATVTDAGIPTYAVSGVIDYTDQVDVYDGERYNGYTGSTSLSATTGKLVAYDYFTDTEKAKSGTSRPTFITLAPNSITKIKIYIYIEGQDVDNYDFASLGKKISVQFGFTKERYYDEDIDYTDEGTTATLPDDVIYDKHTPVQ